MPRLKKTDHGTPLKIYLPESVLSKIYLRLYDPELGKIPFGKISLLFEELATKWLEEANDQM